MESVTATNQPQDRTTDLQSKLYQAAMRDKERRFHALHDKLYLPYVLRSAWELVRKNRGAAGVDGQTLKDVEQYGVERFLSEIGQAVREKTYRPQPVRRVLIPKGGDRTKLRPLGIPVVRDRVVQAAAKLVLEPIFEADFGGCSFGFRPGIGQQQALDAVSEHAKRGFRWVVDADIEQFFDNLDHQYLMEALRRRIGDGEMLRLIYRWLKAGYMWEGSLHDTDQGSPQGGVLSPLLANVYLHAFDQAHRTQKTFIGHLTRYADDFIIQCGTEEHARRALDWAAGQLGKFKLVLHPQKTKIVNDRDTGFDFLGFHHRRTVLDCGARRGKESYGVLRWPSRKACARFREQVRLRCGPPAWLRSHWKSAMEELGEFLRGWCHYFRHGQSQRVFKKLDYFLRIRLARNVARGQPRGVGRKRRTWTDYVNHPAMLQAPSLARTVQGAFRKYTGQANVRWRAV